MKHVLIRAPDSAYGGARHCLARNVLHSLRLAQRDPLYPCSPAPFSDVERLPYLPPMTNRYASGTRECAMAERKHQLRAAEANMGTRKAIMVLASLSLALSEATSAEELDLSVAAKNLLFSKIQKFEVQNEGPLRFNCSNDGSLLDTNPTLTRNGKCEIFIRNIHAVSSDVAYSDVKPAALPVSEVREVWQYANCKTTPTPINDSISVRTSEGNTIVRTTSLSQADTSTVQANFAIPLKINASIGLTNSQTVNFQQSDNQSTNLQQDRTTSQQIVLQVPPRTVHYVTLSRTLANSYVNFDGVVAIDGDVIFQPKWRHDDSNAGPEKALGKLSTFIPAEADRTVHLKGQVWNAKGIDVKRQDDEKPVDSVPGVCQSSNILLQSAKILNKVPEGSGQLKKLKIQLSSSSYFAPVGGVETTEPLLDGMVITTSENSYANVEVRAQSMGPGFCAVGINSNFGSANFLAPPLTWSPWTTLFASAGSVSATLTTSVGCDTGAQFEVRYYR